jgi:hypothetical protein
MGKLGLFVLLVVLCACNNTSQAECTTTQVADGGLQPTDAGVPTCILGWSCASTTFALACAPTDSTGADIVCSCYDNNILFGTNEEINSFDCDPERGLSWFQQICGVTLQPD